MEGRYVWFGVLTLLEVVVAGVGCFVLGRRRQGRWMAWWVALVVAVHFVLQAFLLGDWPLAALGLVQFAGLVVLLPRPKAIAWPTSRWVGPFMGATLVVFAVPSAVVFVITNGTPW